MELHGESSGGGSDYSAMRMSEQDQEIVGSTFGSKFIFIEIFGQNNAVCTLYYISAYWDSSCYFSVYWDSLKFLVLYSV